MAFLHQSTEEPNDILEWIMQFSVFRANRQKNASAIS